MTEQKSSGRRRAQLPADASAPATPAAATASQANAAATAAPQAPAGELRRPRGEARRRALAAPERPAAPVPPVAGPAAAAAPGGYIGRRYATSMRYGVPTTAVRPHSSIAEDAAWDFPGVTTPAAAAAWDVPGTAAAAPEEPAPQGRPEPAPVPAAAPLPSPAAVAAPAADNVARFPVPVERDSLGLSHKIAAVAAVSGLAFAAAYPALAGEPAEEERVAKAAVSDVTVPASDDYAIERTALTSSFTKDDQLDYLMSASEGDVTKIDTQAVLAQPVDSRRITSKFGPRQNPTGAGFQVHIGQDYGIKCGTPVKAAASGKVVQAGWAGHSGNRVRVDHGNGLETTYNHNTSLKVKVGDTVDRGQVVSLSGTTGNSTGCHLHFEVLVDGEAVDPAGWL